MSFMCASYSKRKRGFPLGQIKRYSLALFFAVLFSGFFLSSLTDISEVTRLTEDTVSSMDFRSQPLDDEQIREAE